MDGIIKLDPLVAECCEQIRSGWSDREWNKRWRGPGLTRWSVPTASDDDIEAAEKEVDQ